ncbi:MAG: dihydrolipoyl dehydrogenase [Desulforhopalus sp.]|nr:dihydrolipoyl dehydrogenase [Desulforhopalus sp.]
MSEEKVYDVLVLGGGPGGYTAAFRAADLGLAVCLVENEPVLGGTCLHVGCIPSKTLLHAAAAIEEACQASEYGIDFPRPQIDLGRLLAKKNAVIQQLAAGLDGLCKARKITRLNGYGCFTSRSSLVVTGAEGKQEEVQFRNAIIATGSRPFVLPDIPADPRIWDSTAALHLKSVPERLLIIGGGIIGLEMAQIYSALGAKITIVEMLDQIIPPADKDLVQPLFLKLKKHYSIFTKTKVTKILLAADCIEAQFAGTNVPEGGQFDAVLIAVGRRPNTAGMGLVEIGLQLNERGFLQVDERQVTNIPHFYGVGDVVGEPMLAHKASHEGKLAAEIIAGYKAELSSSSAQTKLMHLRYELAINPGAIPSVAYTNPEIAWVGLTEKEAKAKNIEFDKGKFLWGASGRALSVGAQMGVTKALFDKANGRILGAGICGMNAGELIHEAVLALAMGATARDIGRTVHAHPTLAETFAFAAEIVDGSITDALPPKQR